MGRPPTYAWDKILPTRAGVERTFIPDQDFKVSSASFQQQAMNEARRRGLPIKSRRMKNGNVVLRAVGRKKRYPWDKWLDGGSHGLQRNTDFYCEPKSLQVQLHNAAKRRGLKVRTAIYDSQSLIIQGSWNPNGYEKTLAKNTNALESETMDA